jgi:hypothetical protein
MLHANSLSLPLNLLLLSLAAADIAIAGIW